MRKIIRRIFDILYILIFALLPINTRFSLKFWLILRDILNTVHPESDSLFQQYNIKVSNADSLVIPELRKVLNNDTLGVWSLDEKTICILWDKLFRQKPALILECGAGVSTLTFARYASLSPLSGGGYPHVITIEQSGDVKASVEKRLKEHDLFQYVCILHVPVHDGNYQVKNSELQDSLKGKLADWLVIDGPFGEAGCRITTLPSLQYYCKHHATWFLDDALRDGELEALKSWSKIRGVCVSGIYAVGKGLACGSFYK